MQITPEIVASFRLVQLAFTDTTKWPEAIVQEALCEADCETGSSRWGAYEDDCHNLKRRGLYYFAAHWLSVTYPTGLGATDPTNVPSTARLNVAAKSIGDESVTYRVGAIQETENDWLSLTNYGVQFLRLRRRVGMGAKAV
ncbi:DUF4054 domain-containing protein [Pseudomonas corrugata]|uniref:DUF4054 domain-containing protein n=1 Tax=Pseudomonas corrugata TaxID=47879 RepID=UPI003D81B343